VQIYALSRTPSLILFAYCSVRIPYRAGHCVHPAFLDQSLSKEFASPTFPVRTGNSMLLSASSTLTPQMPCHCSSNRKSFSVFSTVVHYSVNYSSSRGLGIVQFLTLKRYCPPTKWGGGGFKSGIN
jgi:hypothetical protein